VVFHLALVPLGFACACSHAKDEASIPPPPPPLTTAPDPNRWVNLVLENRYPGRSWGTVSANPNNSGISADYTLTEPEYLPWAQEKGPGGEDLRLLRQLSVAFKSRCRQPGDKGHFSATGLSQQLTQINSTHSSATTTILVFDGLKDTPETPGAAVGTALSQISQTGPHSSTSALPDLRRNTKA
jgi:hypothetical protein